MALVAGLGTAVLTGGVTGVLAGAAALVGLRRWQRSAAPGALRRSESADTRSGRDAVRRQLPVTADLLAACLEAGATPCDATEAVGRSVGEPLGGALRQVAAELRLGSEPGEAWARLRSQTGADDLARCMERASSSGAPPVRQVAALAAECRAADSREMHRRARRAGVLATAPLGLCFLPAFLLVGVVPMVIGLAGGMLSQR